MLSTWQLRIRCESDQEALNPPRNLLWRACRRTEPSERIDRQRERRSIDGRGTGMLACEICSRTSDRDREIENLREDREAILTIDARESKEECCDALGVLARHHDDCKSSLRSMGHGRDQS